MHGEFEDVDRSIENGNDQKTRGDEALALHTTFSRERCKWLTEGSEGSSYGCIGLDSMQF